MNRSCLLTGSYTRKRLDCKSRMNREVHVRFCESAGVKFPCATRPFVLIFDYPSAIVEQGDHMTRSARMKSNSGIYHNVIRGINHQRIFEDDKDCLPNYFFLAADLCSFYLPNTNTEGQRLCDKIGVSTYHVTQVEIGECDA